jgi:antitoxin MazE
MKVTKWGHSLAVRLPAPLALELGLKEGDEIELVRNPDGAFEVSSEDARGRAIESRRALRVAPLQHYMFIGEEP